MGRDCRCQLRDNLEEDFESVRGKYSRLRGGLGLLHVSYSHPTTSPVSFGAVGSPSVSGSAVPGGAMSSPGRMSDIEGTSFCAGIPPLSSGGVQRPSMISGGGSGGVQIPPMSSGGDLGRVPSPPGLSFV